MYVVHDVYFFFPASSVVEFEPYDASFVNFRLKSRYKNVQKKILHNSNRIKSRRNLYFERYLRLAFWTREETDV